MERNKGREERMQERKKEERMDRAREAEHRKK